MNKFLALLFVAFTLSAAAFGQSNRTLIEDETARAIAAETVLQEAIDDLPVFADAPTGVFKLDEFTPEAPINTSTNAVGTNIDLGMDFTQSENMTLTLVFADQANGQAWQNVNIDVDKMLANFEAEANLDAYALIFDNDWMRVNVVDPATGVLNFVDQGRDMQFVKAELFVSAPTVDGLIAVQNPPASFITTGVFQNYGDPNPLFTGDDGDTIHIGYGDGNRDQIAFIEGLAKAERRGFATSDLEVRAVDGQLSMRDLGSQSGIAFLRYETMQGVVRTQVFGAISSPDYTVDVVTDGTSNTLSIDPIAINEYLNNRDPYHIAVAHEGAGGTNLTVSFNGVPATYDNLLNATDGGNGVVSFSGGVNGNFNRRAGTVEALLDVGDTFTITKPATGQFDSQHITFSADPSLPANSSTDTYRLSFNATQYSLRNPENVVVTTGTPENGEFEVTRILEGLLFKFNGAEIYRSEATFTDYSAGTATASTIDPLEGFSEAAKVDFLALSDGRPVTVIEDTEPTTVTTERAFDGAAFRFAELTFVRDPGATHAPYVRVNTPGTGRQSQVQMSLRDGSFNAVNSGANTSTPIVREVTVAEETITYLIEFTDIVGHTEFELAPAGTNTLLATDPATPGVVITNFLNDPAKTGRTGVVSVELFEVLPSRALAHSVVSGVNVFDFGNGFVRMWGQATGVDSITLPIALGAPGDWDAQITTIGATERHIQFDLAASNATTFGVARIGNTAAEFNWSVFGQKQ